MSARTTKPRATRTTGRASADEKARKAAARKAAVEKRKAAVEKARGILHGIGDAIGEVLGRIADAETRIAHEWVEVGIRLHEGACLIESEPQLAKGGDWRNWANEVLPGLSPPRVYALRNAGAVAAVLGDSVGTTSADSLVPLYRILKAAGEDEEKQAAAETAVRTTFEKVRDACPTGKTPTELAMREAVEKVMPQGTRGKAGKTAAQKAAAKKAAAARKAAAVEKVDRELRAVEDPGSRDACRKDLKRGTAKLDEGTEVLTGLTLILFGVKLSEEYGSSLAYAIVTEEIADAKKAAKGGKQS